MPVTATDLRAHMRYSAWASRRIVDALAILNDVELARDFQTADKTVIATLAHIYAADRIWLARVQGQRPEKFIDPDVDCRMETLRDDWPALFDRWDAVLGAQSDQSVEHLISYHNLKGEALETPLWQIVLHVVNHGTHHRGQVSGFLRAMGHVPPVMDLNIYYREQK
jgi:uncharacterized damage-inducible protein DinB